MQKENQSQVFVPESQNESGGVVPYLIGWMLGVPGIILVIIYLLRH